MQQPPCSISVRGEKGRGRSSPACYQGTPERGAGATGGKASLELCPSPSFPLPAPDRRHRGELTPWAVLEAEAWQVGAGGRVGGGREAVPWEGED